MHKQRIVSVLPVNLRSQCRARRKHSTSEPSSGWRNHFDNHFTLLFSLSSPAILSILFRLDSFSLLSMSMILIWKMGIVFGILSGITFNGDGGGDDLLIIFCCSAYEQTARGIRRFIDKNIPGTATPELEMIIRNSWTSKSFADFLIRMSTLCAVRIHSRWRSAIQLKIPFIRRWIELWKYCQTMNCQKMTRSCHWQPSESIKTDIFIFQFRVCDG